MISNQRPLSNSADKFRSSGFSLLELFISLSLLFILSSSVAMALISTQGLSRDIFVTTQVTSDLERLIERLSRKLTSGVEIVTSTDTSIIFQEPVDLLSDGNYYDSNNNLVYGADGEENWAYEFLWIRSGSYVEVTEGIDLNSDGDITDLFESGDLVYRILNETGGVERTIRLTSNGNIVRHDFDSLPPLFNQTDENTIEIILSMPAIDVQRGQRLDRLMQVSKTVSLR